MAPAPEYDPIHYYGPYMPPPPLPPSIHPSRPESYHTATVHLFCGTHPSTVVSTSAPYGYSYGVQQWRGPPAPAASPSPTAPPPPYVPAQLPWNGAPPTPAPTAPGTGAAGTPAFESLTCDSHILFHVIKVPPYANHADLFASNYVKPRFKPLRVSTWAPTDSVLKALVAGQAGWAVTEAISWTSMGATDPNKRGAWMKGVTVKFGDKTNAPNVDGWGFVSLGVRCKAGDKTAERPVWIVAHKV